LVIIEMNRNISLFVDKFRVKGEIKNSIHKFLRDEEIAILNYNVSAVDSALTTVPSQLFN